MKYLGAEYPAVSGEFWEAFTEGVRLEYGSNG